MLLAKRRWGEGRAWAAECQGRAARVKAALPRPANLLPPTEHQVFLLCRITAEKFESAPQIGKVNGLGQVRVHAFLHAAFRIAPHGIDVMAIMGTVWAPGRLLALMARVAE